MIFLYIATRISDDLRAVAFQKAIEILARSSELPAGSSAAAQRNDPATTDERGVARIVRKLSISTGVAGEIYSDNKEGGVDVVVGVGKLDNSTATATKQLALLAAGARQLTEIEEWTEVREVRTICIHYGRFDSPNFAKTVKQMDDAFSFRGKGQQLEVRLHQRGIEKLKQLIGTLTSG